jgi:hypothetical protein
MTTTIVPMIRKLTLAVLLAAVLTGTALAGQPREQHTAADMALAKKIGFVRADFPAGWTAKPATPDKSAGTTTCKGFDPNEADLVETGKVDSSIFTAPDTFSQVFSTVGVFKTVAQARSSWGRTASLAALECFSQLITANAPAGSTISALSKGKLAFPKVSERIAAYRLVIGVAPEGAKASVKLYLDRILLGAGRANVSTIMFSLGQPYPAAFEQKLAKAIAARLP